MEKYIIMKNIKLLFQTKCDKYLERAKKLKSHLEKKTNKNPQEFSVIANNNHDRKKLDCSIKLDCKICFSESPESLWILRCQSSQIMGRCPFCRKNITSRSRAYFDR